MNFKNTYSSLFREECGELEIQYHPSEDGNVFIEESRIKTGYSGTRLIYSAKNIFQEIFLPQGYPSSISPDYITYQIWDTVQAFCSTISGILTTHAVLKGVGVGDQEASALSATITWIFKDGTGMIGRIAFAWWKGFLLDTDCKKWRLAADIINDGALGLELLLGLPSLKNYNFSLLCVSTGMKAIVGVAGGATRAAITQHQAVRGNLGDVSAKDGSQETCVNLFSSFFGLFILTRIETNVVYIWVLFLLVTIIHIYANYKAVKSLQMKTFNTQRFLTIIDHYLKFNWINGSIKWVNDKENVFLGFGITDKKICDKNIFMGKSLKEIFNKRNFDANYLNKVKFFYNTYEYLIIPTKTSIYVMLGKNLPNKDILKAYFHAVVYGIVLSHLNGKAQKGEYSKDFQQIIDSCREIGNIETHVNQFVNLKWNTFYTQAMMEGWNLNRHQLSVDEWRMKFY